MNNNDKQLLIDAARAVGYPVPEPVGTYPWQGFEIDGTFYWLSDPEGRTRKTWNPLKNDSDAFRLMVDLDIELSISKEFHPGTIISGIGLMPFNKKIDVVDGDRLAATRRAITTAAAELWRARRDQA